MDYNDAEVGTCNKGRDKYKDECPWFCEKQHPKPKKIFLECGNNPQAAIFEVDHHRYNWGQKIDKHDQTFVLDSVLVDTTCLFKPIVKIEFSSIIYFEVEAEHNGPVAGDAVDNAAVINGGHKKFKVDLLFELVRVCRGVKDCVQSWRYLQEYEIERNDKLEVKISEPFTVTFCDKTCSDCCEYKMIVTAKNLDGDFDALRVVKPDISALAQGQCSD